MALLALIAILVSLPATSLASESRATTSRANPSARAELMIVRVQPLSVAGRAFKASEQVRLSADGRRKTVTTGARGGFTVAFPEASACNGVTVVARGSKGSRASVNFAQFSNVHCLEPGASSARASAARPAARATLKIVATDPVSVAGRAFKPGERVRLSAGGRRRSVTADPRGGFKVFFPGATVCGGILVVARGSEGSHASVSFANLSSVHCLEPGTKG